MRLLPEWRQIIRHAWSVRLMLLAVALSALEAALPYLPLPIPHGLAAALASIVALAAGFSRLVAQQALQSIKFTGTEEISDADKS